MSILRRSFLMGGAVLASLAGAFGVSRLVSGAGDDALDAEAIRGMLPMLAGDVAAAGAIGHMLIEDGQVEGGAEVIAERLAASLSLYRGTPRQRFAELQRREFAGGTVVQLRGWILPRSLCDACVLTALIA